MPMVKSVSESKVVPEHNHYKYAVTLSKGRFAGGCANSIGGEITFYSSSTDFSHILLPFIFFCCLKLIAPYIEQLVI